MTKKTYKKGIKTLIQIDILQNWCILNVIYSGILTNPNN